MVRLSFLLISAAFCFTATAPNRATADELTEAEFQRLHSMLQPDPSAAWRTIPWQTSVVSAQQLAAEQQKPLFIWAMDGHPLGCT